MKRKKKGSSLVVVVVIMAILFTVGTAMLAVTLSDYKMRINESKKIENLYKADSGLDIVYNIILKASEASILASEKATEDATKEESLGINKSLEELDYIFRNKYLETLGKEAIGYGKNPDDALLARAISEGKYCEFNAEENKVIFIGNSFNNAKIEILQYSYSGDKIMIRIKSTFEDSKMDIKNTKTIETSYVLSIPKYQKNIVNESINKEITIYPVFDNKIITADGNMSISGEVDIKGDIWVMGNGELGNKPAYAFDKYNGGVSIEKARLNISGNISTNKTLHLRTESNVEIDGNVYALNAYVGKYYDNERRLTESSNNSLKPKSDSELNLVVNNDLAMNAQSSNINLTNFYGINDKTIYNADSAEKAMKSSSIIVNGTDSNSSLKVINDAYIMGVANIDANDEKGNKYQTGESVAVKGNYLAYNSILPEYEDRVTLKYYSPLQLIDTIDGNNSVEVKAQYFKEYYEENSDKLKNGGISLNNVKAIGAYIKDGKVENLGFSGDDTLNEKRNEFATNVYSMSDTFGIAKSIEELYANRIVEKTVSNQIDFFKLDSNQVTNETYGKIYINTFSNSNSKKNVVVIKGNNDNNSYDDTSDINYEFIDGSTPIKSVIITNGDIKITGDIDFTGNIITTGNVEFITGGKKNLVYDSEVTRKIIAANYDAVKEGFEEGKSIGQVDNVNIGEITIIQDTTNGYDMKSLLSNGTWKIVK